ncbi:MAG: LCP family protein [Clostridia bacterium]|nr:LCP family protein [Clostridia bacterium]
MRKKILKTGIFLICLIIVAYLGVRTAFFITSPFGQIEVGDELDKVEVTNGNIVLNALVMGLDKDETRTDTILFVSYNSENGKCFVMSIPRDTYVNVDGRPIMINSAYAKGGLELTINKVKDLTGLPINYYVVFTFKDFRKVIDALGGVEFDVRPEGYYYEDPYQDLIINIPGGYQVLDGEKAEGLVRYRADYPRADLERVEVQQKFVRALIEQKFNAEYIASIPKVYDAIKDTLKSNLSLSALLSYSGEIIEGGVTSIETHTLPTITYGAHLLPDEDAIEKLLSEYFPED